jgi:hypothetical protein
MVVRCSPRQNYLTDLPKVIQSALYALFLLGVCLVCYRRPMPDEFDRYIYEAIVRGRTQPIEQVYDAVKHESPRAESSTVLDSPQHLRELEPLYAIRPLYIEIVSLASAFLSIPNAINFVSAASFFGIGIVVYLWTGKPVLSALLLSPYQVLLLGRAGTPDGLAALLVVLGLWFIHRNRSTLALCVLFVSLAVRTDNVLVLLAVLTWLTLERKLLVYKAVLLAALGVVVVVGINRWAGNYGWVVLFRYSFVSGRYPALIPHTLTFREYFAAFFSGIAVIMTRVALWLLLGMFAYLHEHSRMLLVCAAAVAAHFAMFPSQEDRYLVWAYIVVGSVAICTFGADTTDQTTPLTRRAD